MPQTFVLPRQLALDDDANPLSGAFLYFYQTGTDTPQEVYVDAALTTPHPNPISSDSSGRWPKIYLNPDATADYRVRITDADGVEIYQEDDIDRFTIAQSEIVRALYPRTSAEIAAGITPASYAYPSGNILRYGAVADGNFTTGAGTDCKPAIQAAIDLASQTGGGYVDLPAGVFKLASQIVIPDGVTVTGTGRWSTILFAPNAFNDATGLVRITGGNGYPATFGNCAVLGQNGGSGGSGIVTSKNGVFIRDIWVAAFTSAPGIILGGTDNFLEDFVVELCLYGIENTQTHQNVADGTLYLNSAAGALIENGSSLENGRVTYSNVRASDNVQDGFIVSAGKAVTFSGCSAIGSDNTKATSSGIFIDSSDDVIINGFSGRVTGTVSTAGAGIKLTSSTNVSISGSDIRGFQDGARLTNCTNISITGGNYRSNGRRGVYAAGGHQINVSGVNATSNGGGGSTDAGIYSENTAADSIHSITGCVAVQASGGVQEYGIYATLTDNGGSTGYTNVSGNTARFNGTKNISLNGALANITSVGNIPDNYDGVITTVASAATIALPYHVDIITISGTTNITSITATGHRGHTVKLIFADVLTFTDGSNLKIAGNFVTTTDDTITLWSDGTSWFELSRSVN